MAQANKKGFLFLVDINPYFMGFLLLSSSVVLRRWSMVRSWSVGTLYSSILSSPLQPSEELGGTPRFKKTSRSPEEELDSQGANVSAEKVHAIVHSHWFPTQKLPVWCPQNSLASFLSVDKHVGRLCSRRWSWCNHPCICVHMEWRPLLWTQILNWPLLVRFNCSSCWLFPSLSSNCVGDGGSAALAEGLKVNCTLLTME